jgi:hypothetical protein
VTSEEARKAIVSFLDQFIERGAASDVIALRDRLRDDPNGAAEIASLLPGDDATSAQVFEAMRRLFSAEPAVEREQSPDLSELHSWTTLEADGLTSDPAQWEDWLSSLATPQNE